MKLESWSIIALFGHAYEPPELAVRHLRGIVFGHPHFDDGTRVITATITSIQDECFVTRSGSIYELGEPDPDYEKAFPNAKQRAPSNVPSATTPDARRVDMAELHPEHAKETAASALRFLASFDGQEFGMNREMKPEPHDGRHLAIALDYIQELGAMVLNWADRVPPNEKGKGRE